MDTLYLYVVDWSFHAAYYNIQHARERTKQNADLFMLLFRRINKIAYTPVITPNH
jgi:hypothetical protein